MLGFAEMIDRADTASTLKVRRTVVRGALDDFCSNADRKGFVGKGIGIGKRQLSGFEATKRHLARHIDGSPWPTWLRSLHRG